MVSVRARRRGAHPPRKVRVLKRHGVGEGGSELTLLLGWHRPEPPVLRSVGDGTHPGLTSAT
jgi:hypothetical protein